MVFSRPQYGAKFRFGHSPPLSALLWRRDEDEQGDRFANARSDFGASKFALAAAASTISLVVGRGDGAE